MIWVIIEMVWISVNLIGMLKLQEQLADRPVGRRVVYGTARLVVQGDLTTSPVLF